jgi:flagellum-specific peptidoglycan hydrolase FlgJ
MSVSSFIASVSAAVRAVAGEFGLPPRPVDAFVTAHAALSSGWGRSTLAAQHNNLFGVKAGASWTGATVDLTTTDYDDATGAPTVHVQRWRVYPSIEASIRDHLRLVTTTPRYRGSASLLRSGDPEYMAQMGRDGWYSVSQVAKTSAEWRSILGRVMAAEGETFGGRAGLLLWAVAGVAAAWVLTR